MIELSIFSIDTIVIHFQYTNIILIETAARAYEPRKGTVMRLFLMQYIGLGYS